MKSGVSWSRARIKRNSPWRYYKEERMCRVNILIAALNDGSNLNRVGLNAITRR
jgi:hypothetical protein